MNVACNRGDFQCESWKELESFIRNSASNPYDDIWLSKETEYPCLTILINGTYACVHYFLNDRGDMWQSVGYGEEEVTFYSNGEASQLPADCIISIEEAIACAKQFWNRTNMPDCIVFREL